jgi:hypothetical protein
MYPVISLLRRLAAAHVYVRKEMLVVADGSYAIRLDKPTDRLDLEAGQWVSGGDRIALSEVSVEAASSVEAAVSLAKKEGRLAEHLRADDLLYTMVIGPEGEQDLPDGRVRRFCRYAIIRGVYRASARRLESVPAKEPKKVSFRKSPTGAVRL